MSEYKSVSMKFSPSQMTKVRSAINSGEGVTIQVENKHVSENGNITLNLTKTQVDKIRKLYGGKQVRLNLSKTQPKSGKTNVNKSNKVDKVCLKLNLRKRILK